MLRSPVAAAKPHDQASSVTYGRYGAKSRSSTESPCCAAATAELRPAASVSERARAFTSSR